MGQDALADLDPDTMVMSEEKLVEGLADMGLTWHRFSEHHCQVREDGKVLANYWPTTGNCNFIRDPKYKPSAHSFRGLPGGS